MKGRRDKMIEKFPLNISDAQGKRDIFDQLVFQEKESFDFGFYWESFDQVFDQVTSECAEVKEAFESNARDHLGEEIGDLIHSSISLCILCGFDPRKIVSDSHYKYQKRFESLVRLAKEDGHKSLKGQPTSVLLGYWKRAKEEDL